MSKIFRGKAAIMHLALRDKSLSLGAKGLLAFILDKGYDWTENLPDIVEGSKDSESTIGFYAMELVRHGYFDDKKWPEEVIQR